MTAETPVVLFSYARPDVLTRTLECLRENRVRRILAFSDAPASPDKEPQVRACRSLLRAVDWCDLRLTERTSNLGLGASILDGVGGVLREYEAVIVFEDDLVCVPGTYDYLCAALARYRNAAGVMSVTGWTHPCVTPDDVGTRPYFDGRSECWVWGTWQRAWAGMERTALSLMQEAEERGIPADRFGADLCRMARVEAKAGIWAVRLMYNHIRQNGLCLRPPWSMVEHIGAGREATHVKTRAERWVNPPLKPCPPVPAVWPEPAMHPRCSDLWRAACGVRTAKPHCARSLLGRVRRMAAGWVRGTRRDGPRARTAGPMSS